MANRIILNGIDYSNDVAELQDIESLTYELDETTRTVQKSVSSDFTFTGAAYDFLFGIFYSDTSTGCNAKVQVVLTLDCCSIPLVRQITFRGTTHCPDKCNIKAVLTKDNDDNVGFDCLNKTRLFDNNVLNNITLPHLEYCTGAGFRSLGALVFAIVSTIFGIINVLILILNALPGVDIPFLGSEIIDGLLGCDRQAPGFVVKEALEFQANECGLGFQSVSILDLPNYQRTTVIPMSITDGKNNCPDLDLLMENRPNVSVISFVGSMEPLFDSDFRVKGSTLFFETKTWFEDNLQLVGDVDNLIFDDEGICYQYDVLETYSAYGRFEYAYDVVDIWGNMSSNHYNEIVEWNPSGNENQKGEHLNIAEAFSPLHILGMGLFLQPGALVQLIGHGVIYEGITGQWKIYTWDGAETCKSRTVNSFTSGYNYPFRFTQGLPDGSLYDTFHSHKNPNNSPCPLKTEDFTFAVESFCDMVQYLEQNGTDIYISCPYGKIKPGVVEVDLITKSFTWSDNRVIKPT
jgi:hypothetical protein